MFFLFPLGHEQQVVRRWPVVTIAIIALCFIMHIYVDANRRGVEERIDQTYENLRRFYQENHERISIDPELITRGITVDEWSKKVPEESLVTNEDKEFNRLVLEILNARDSLISYKYGFFAHQWNIGLITYQFIHGGWFHLITNMWFLWLAGSILEDLWGRFIFAIYYVVCGMFAAFAHSIFYWNSHEPVIGASGAIAGLMGAFLIKFFHTRITMFWVVFIFFFIRYGTFKAPAFIMLILWFLQQLGYGLLDTHGLMGVAFWAHVGGFVFGVGSAYLLKKTRAEDKYLTSKVEAITTFAQDESVVKAMNEYEQNNIEEAELLLTGVLAKEPRNADARLLMFQIKHKKGDYQSAVVHLTGLIECYIQKNDIDSAIELYRQNQGMYPDVDFSPASVMRLVQHFKEINDLESAVQLLYKTYMKHPDDLAGYKALSYYAEISSMMNRHEEVKKAYELLLSKELPEELRAHIMQKIGARKEPAMVPRKEEPALPQQISKGIVLPEISTCGPVSYNILKITRLMDNGLAVIQGDEERELSWNSIKYLSIVRIKNAKNQKPYHDYLVIDCIDTTDKIRHVPVNRTFSFNLLLSSIMPDAQGGPMDMFIAFIEKVQSRSHCIIIQPENIYTKKFTSYEIVNDYNTYLMGEIEKL
jgi:membrane associated rhomboid family serine protease/tetratricopeptide (TPR) repeat protein